MIDYNRNYNQSVLDLPLCSSHAAFVERLLHFCALLMSLPLPQFGSENQQLEWAKRASEWEEQERLRRLQLQEQQDLELAIALSKADMSGS